MTIVDTIQYGEIVVKGKTYYSDLVLWWNGKKALLEKTHLMTKPLILRLLQEAPDSVVVGVGLKGTVRISSTVKPLLQKRGIPLFIDKTQNAKEIFNAFVKIGKKPVGVFHVTL